jgi:hypothetical protein
LYANDATIFVSPTTQDITRLKSILDVFGQASGLLTNLLKSDVFLITYKNAQLELIMEGFPATVKSFPCYYFSLPLHLKKLRKVDYMPLLDKIGEQLPSWKGKLMTKVARAQLVKSVLTSTVTYHTTVFNLQKWHIKKINKIRRNFFRKGKKARATRVDHA